MELAFKFEGETYNNKQVNKYSRQFQVVISAKK